MAWTGTTILALWRKLTGRNTTYDISDADALVVINDYYQEDFPLEIVDHQIETDWTDDTTATDDGEYDVGDTQLDLKKPIYLDGDELIWYYESSEFFRNYPEFQDEGFVTAPGIAIGSSDTTAVLNEDLRFKIGDNIYDLASTETALSGDDIPQGTYGAWLLSVDADGSIPALA